MYITFDIDALDATVMPATGTPTPEGLSFRLALDLLRRALPSNPAEPNRQTMLWPNARAEIAQHRTHWIVSITGNDRLPP